MIDRSANLNFIQADYAGYPAQTAGLKSNYLEYPRYVSIETQVACNAKSSFCPYPASPRQGQKMSDEVFLKIINDLRRIPQSHTFGITLHRINEPLLDQRMEDFCSIVAGQLPNAAQQFWTNGTMLKKGDFEWMTQYPKAFLTVSLNSVIEEEHMKLMGFGLDSVFQGLDYLHQLFETGKFTLPVTLCAPFINEQQASGYLNECKRRWPLFNPVVRPVFQWMGESGSGAEYRATDGLSESIVTEVPQFACGQWLCN